MAGARSIRGALGTYAVCAVLLVGLLGLVLWLGPSGATAGVTLLLPAEGPWQGAALDEGGARFELRAGEQLELPAGSYRLTRFLRDGRSEQQPLELPAGAPPCDLAALPSALSASSGDDAR